MTEFAFPILAPDVPETHDLMGAWKLAKQKWELEQDAADELATLKGRGAPIGVIKAQERKCFFADEETERAFRLYLDQQRIEQLRERQHRRTA